MATENTLLVKVKDKSIKQLFKSLEAKGMIEVSTKKQVRKRFLQSLDNVSKRAEGTVSEEEIRLACEDARQKIYEKKNKSRH